MTRNTCRRAGIAGALASLLVVASPPASAGFPVIDVSNLAQSIISAIQSTMEVSQQVRQLGNEARQIGNQVQQIQNEVRMLEDMARNSLQSGDVTWGDVDRMLATLANTVNTGRAIAYSAQDLDADFRARFPGYVPPSDWSAAYQDWSQTSLDSLRGTMMAAGINVADAPTVDAALGQLRAENRSSEGRLQAIMVGNQLASLQVEEMTKLRGLMASQISAQNAYFAVQETKLAGSEAAARQWIGNGRDTVNPAMPDAGFDVVPRP